VEISDQILSDLSVQTSSGDMRLNAVQASTIAMESSSGDHTAEGLNAGQATITSSSGEIRVRDLQGSVKAESSSGDITLRYREFTSDLEVRSSSGDVELFLTEAAEFRVEARASSGDIDCAFPVTLNGADSEARRNHLFGAVGEGTHRVVVRTSSGDITIRP
jgi:lia operon protein LiaG